MLNLLGKLLGQRSYEVLDKIVHGGKQLWSAFNADADDDEAAAEGAHHLYSLDAEASKVTEASKEVSKASAEL